MSPPHIGPEDSAVINSLTFDCVANLFTGAPTLTFHNILHISPSPPRQVSDSSAGALPHPEDLPAWVGQVVRNNNVAARFNRKQLIRVCKGVRSEIQHFEADFQAKNGRRPNPGSDRAPIAAKYENYRALKKFVRANAACKIQATFRGYLGRRTGVRLMEEAKARAPVSAKPMRVGASSTLPEPKRDLRPKVETAKVSAAPVSSGVSQQDPATSSNHHDQDSIEGYLSGAQARLAEEQARTGRPMELAQMSAAELEEEKSFIKYELKRFDDLLGAQLGRPLKKADKEPMRPLYSRYHEIKNMLASGVPADDVAQADVHILQDTSNKAAMAPVSKTVPEPRVSSAPPLADDRVTTEKYQQLKHEKRALQQKLHQYESEFFRKHGRKMKHHEDIAPVQQEYTEYKRLKGVLATMEAQGLVA